MLPIISKMQAYYGVDKRKNLDTHVFVHNWKFTVKVVSTALHAEQIIYIGKLCVIVSYINWLSFI